MSHKFLLAVAALAFGAVILGDTRPAQASTLTAEDRLEIQELYARYAQAYDLADGTPEAWAATFTAAGVMGNSRGRAQLIEHWKATHAAPNRPVTRHWTNHLVLTPTSDGARAKCYLTLFNFSATPPTMMFSGVYDDVLVKTAEGWKFKERVLRGDVARPAGNVSSGSSSKD